MFTTSETTGKLDAALAKAQASVQAALKDKVNPAFRSKYADLSAVWEACREALTDNGVNVTQWPLHSEDNRLHLVTRLGCEGEWMQAEFSLPVGKQDAHGYGSATTYAKRFALAAAVGVVADEDDDGNAASSKDEKGKEEKPRTRVRVESASGTAPPPPPAAPPAVLRDQVVKLYFALPDALRQKFLTIASIETIDDLPDEKLAKALKVIPGLAA